MHTYDTFGANIDTNKWTLVPTYRQGRNKQLHSKKLIRLKDLPLYIDDPAFFSDPSRPWIQTLEFLSNACGASVAQAGTVCRTGLHLE